MRKFFTSLLFGTCCFGVSLGVMEAPSNPGTLLVHAEASIKPELK